MSRRNTAGKCTPRDEAAKKALVILSCEYYLFFVRVAHQCIGSERSAGVLSAAQTNRSGT